MWGCPAEARSYRPNEKKLDSRTVSIYFISYSERSRGYKFCDPKLIKFFRRATFFEDIEFGGKNKVRDFVIEEESIIILEPIHTVAFDQASMEPP